MSDVSNYLLSINNAALISFLLFINDCVIVFVSVHEAIFEFHLSTLCNLSGQVLRGARQEEGGSDAIHQNDVLHSWFGKSLLALYYLVTKDTEKNNKNILRNVHFSSFFFNLM